MLDKQIYVIFQYQSIPKVLVSLRDSDCHMQMYCSMQFLLGDFTK